MKISNDGGRKGIGENETKKSSQMVFASRFVDA